MIPQQDEYLSYFMGAPAVSDEDLTALRITVVETKPEGRCLVVPECVLPAYTQLLRDHLESGYWNEIVGRSRIVFFYQLPDGPFTEHTYSDATRSEIARLCSELNDDPIEWTSDMPRYLASNPFYTELMVARHGAAAT